MRSEDIKYVIIQAGGKGIRMGRYAENKPKCLVPVKGIPMIMNTIETVSYTHLTLPTKRIV